MTEPFTIQMIIQVNADGSGAAVIFPETDESFQLGEPGTAKLVIFNGTLHLPLEPDQPATFTSTREVYNVDVDD